MRPWSLSAPGRLRVPKYWIRGWRSETPTIRFASLENLENFGRRFLAAHPVSFFDSGDRRVAFLSKNHKVTIISPGWAAGYFRPKFLGFSGVTNSMSRVSSPNADPESNIGTPLIFQVKIDQFRLNPCFFISNDDRASEWNRKSTVNFWA